MIHFVDPGFINGAREKLLNQDPALAQQLSFIFGPIFLPVNFLAWLAISGCTWHPDVVHRGTYARELKELNALNDAFFFLHHVGVLPLEGSTFTGRKITGCLRIVNQGEAIAITVDNTLFEMTTVVYSQKVASGVVVWIEVFRTKEAFAPVPLPFMTPLWIEVSRQVMLEDLRYLRQNQSNYLLALAEGKIPMNAIQQLIWEAYHANSQAA